MANEFTTTPYIAQVPPASGGWGSYVMIGNYIDHGWSIMVDDTSLFPAQQFPMDLPNDNYAWLTVANDVSCPHEVTMTIAPIGQYDDGTVFSLTFRWDDDYQICIPNFIDDKAYDPPKSNFKAATVISIVLQGTDDNGEQNNMHVKLSVCTPEYFAQHGTCPEIDADDIAWSAVAG
eukprot:Clim_evm3s6 gene=Clim_evmTU3s6